METNSVNEGLALTSSEDRQRVVQSIITTLSVVRQVEEAFARRIMIGETKTPKLQAANDNINALTAAIVALMQAY